MSLLSETQLFKEEYVQLKYVQLHNFDCVVKFKHVNVRATEVTMYKNKNIARITKLNLELAKRNADELCVIRISMTGDICTTRVKMDDGREFLLDVVYT